MSDDLNILERLAKQHGAKVTLVFERQTIRATCKMPGMSAETVFDFNSEAKNYYPPESVNYVLRKLVERLGYRGAPTPARFLDLLTPAQRMRLIALCEEFRQIKDSVLHPARCEPRLATPRSSLHPAIVMGEADIPGREE